jgi:hypothetical protein
MNAMRYTPQDIGKPVRETRKGLGVTQKALALTSGTGLRFIIELASGKETAETGKVLTILQSCDKAAAPGCANRLSRYSKDRKCQCVVGGFKSTQAAQNRNALSLVHRRQQSVWPILCWTHEKFYQANF